MESRSSQNLFFRYYVTAIIVVILLGTFSSFYIYTKISRSTQQSLLRNVASVASLFDKDNIRALAGDESDLNNPAYLTLKSQLEKIREINTDIRFVYLWGYRNGNPYFFVDSEPSTSPDYSPPGQVYEEATDVDRAVTLQQIPEAVEISSDRWGTWLTALTPILDPNTGDLIAVMGMDVTATEYYRTLYVYTAIPVITTIIFVLVLLMIGLVLRKREQEFLVLKSDLIAIASHEIRSPLTGISWLTGSLLKGADNLTQKQKDDINTIKNKSEGLLSTINDLLESAAAEKINRTKMAKAPILMRNLFEEIKNASYLILKENNVELKIDDSVKPELAVSGDKERISQMFDNLISNGIKYSKNGGLVTIKARETGSSVVFSIKDEGIGIPKEDQDKIFKGFFRAENAKLATQNGTGLGLYYVALIAKLHDGKVWFESQEGTGSIFYVELPK